MNSAFTREYRLGSTQYGYSATFEVTRRRIVWKATVMCGGPPFVESGEIDILGSTPFDAREEVARATEAKIRQRHQ